jgi:pimeloyl-ACP methyl ester carboxylesterase
MLGKERLGNPRVASTSPDDGRAYNGPKVRFSVTGGRSRRSRWRVKAYRFDPGRFGDLGVPTLVLIGGESPSALRKAGEAVDEALPDSRLVVMGGQGHAAMDTGTDLFTTEVLRFAEGS